MIINPYSINVETKQKSEVTPFQIAKEVLSDSENYTDRLKRKK